MKQQNVRNSDEKQQKVSFQSTQMSSECAQIEAVIIYERNL